MPSRIEDYALIGDCETTALVGRDGSIDWLCFPRIDSPACFAALLGTTEHGRWQIAPAAAIRATRRRYRGPTLVLETEYETDQGVVRLIDFLPPRNLAPDLVRIVEGVRGQVPMRSELIIRFDYGSIVPWVRHWERGIRATAGPDTLYLSSPVDQRGENMHTVAEFTASEGQRLAFVLDYRPTHLGPPGPKDAEQLLRNTEAWWTAWASRCTCAAEWREPVLRSLLTLKALTYAPTGGLAAAATTSLPEQWGGVRNWDYRFCWLRDATFTLYSLMTNGYTEEAKSWREWLVNTVAGDPSKLQIMYGVTGERRLTELELDWLPGYEGAAPVRVGNLAYKQFQLDVYGEVMDALFAARGHGLDSDENAWRIQRAMLRFVEEAWRQPDEGIWEVRGPRRHFTHSKVMAWVAVDRAVKSVEQFGLEGDVARWRRLRKDIHAEVLARGYDPRLRSFVQFYGSKDPDASLLMLPLVGFLKADDPRMLGTVEYIRRRLVQQGFVQRYPCDPSVDGLPPGEGAFLLCTFWLADNLALQGRPGEAREVFERLLAIRNDVGLLAEQYDPVTQRFLGNFPQAFSHVGLISTAASLSTAAGPIEERHQQGKNPDTPGD